MSEKAEEALRLLVEVTECASEASELDTMTERCLARICALKGWPVGQAWFPDERAGVLACGRAFHHDGSVARFEEFRRASLEIRFTRGVGLPGRVWTSLAPAWIDDPPSDENFPRAAFARTAGLKAAFAFPIHRGERLDAVFEFFTPELRDPDHAFLEAVGRLGRHLALVFEKRRLEDARARLAAFVEACPDIIASADPDGRLTYMNAAGRRLLGIGADEDLTPLRIESLYSPESYATLRDRVIPAAVRDGAWRGDLPLRARDGRAVPISHVLIAHRPRGELEFLACVGHDLSHEHRLEAEVRHAQKMEAVGRLAGGMAHDFNNVLASIIVASTVAMKRLEKGHPARADIEAVVDTAERATSLTRQLLAFGRRQVLAPSRVAPDALLRGLERMLRHVVGSDVRLELALADAGEVHADPHQLEHVVLNLAINARDAMPDGGRLTIRTARSGDRVIIEVTDTGTGMDEATRAHLFEPFFTTKDGGTGLGLSTVYGIVKQSGGEIEVDTAPGRGSTFRILLPLA